MYIVCMFDCKQWVKNTNSESAYSYNDSSYFSHFALQERNMRAISERKHVIPKGSVEQRTNSTSILGALDGRKMHKIVS